MSEQKQVKPAQPAVKSGRPQQKNSAAPSSKAASQGRRPQAGGKSGSKSRSAGSAGGQASSGSNRAAGQAGARKSGSTRAPRTPRELALDILVSVAGAGAYSNLKLNQSLQDANLSRADAGLATELVYGTIQHQRTLDYWLTRFVAKGFNKLQPWVHQLLRMSAYQLLYLDRIPVHAAVNEAVSIAKKRGHQGISGMVNGVLRSMDRSRAELVPSAIKAGSPAEKLAILHSYPDWLVKRWLLAYGEQTTEAICAAGNDSPHGSVRVNSVRGTRAAALEQLAELGLDAEASPLAPAGITTRRGGSLVDTDGFREGLWTIQDESSMLVAEVVAPAAGMQVLDCCAAPGGKTTHLAELMGNKGKVWANDLHPHKRQLIIDQSSRLGLTNVEAITSDAAQLSERFASGSMDAVLLDAPCSGFGVIRRKPEIKWTKTAADVAAIADIQRELLEAVSGLVKPGGVLVYSTCTIERSENEEQVEHFLQAHPEFELDRNWPESVIHALQEAGAIDEAFKGYAQLLPQHYGSDGFFIARLLKRA